MEKGIKIVIDKKNEDSYVISVSGSIDSDTYLEFEKKLQSVMGSATKGIVLDMAGLEYISSIGFGVIFRAKQDLNKNGGTLVIAGLKPKVKNIFDAVKAIPESLFATLEAADEYLDNYIALVAKKNQES